MIGFTTNELAEIRTIANQALPDIAIVHRQSLTDDLSGGKLAIWTPAESVACRLSAVNVSTRARDAVIGGRIDPAEGWIVSLPVETSINESDRLEINSTLYEVISAKDRRSYDVNLRLICKRV